MQEKIIPCRWLLCLQRYKAIKEMLVQKHILVENRRLTSIAPVKTCPPPSHLAQQMTMDCAAALRHDCATVSCNSPSASQGPGRTNANGTPAKKKKKVFSSPPPPALPLHHHPKEHGNKAAHRKSIRVGVDPRNVKAKAELEALYFSTKRTKDLRLHLRLRRRRRRRRELRE